MRQRGIFILVVGHKLGHIVANFTRSIVFVLLLPFYSILELRNCSLNSIGSLHVYRGPRIRLTLHSRVLKHHLVRTRSVLISPGNVTSSITNQVVE